MSTELLMEGADAYTSLAEVATAAEIEAPERLIDTIIWSICTLTLQGGC
nr:hypothetical protein [Herbidospora sakaeratensis]